VIIIEDDASIASSIRSKLESIGFTVDKVAKSGKEAISYLNESKADIVLLDINMSGSMDGIKTAEMINKTHDMPVIYLVDDLDMGILERSMETRPHSYMVKPIRRKDLEIRIQIALHSQKIEEEILGKYLEFKKVYQRNEMLNRIRNDVIRNISDNIRANSVDASNAIDEAITASQKMDKKDLTRAKEALRNQLLLFEDLKESLKIDSDAIRISTTAFDFGDLASATVKELRSQGIGAGVEVFPLREKAMVKADYYKIKYILSVIIEHANNLSKGEGKLKIQYKRLNSRIKCSISDISNTIPFEDEKKLFTNMADQEKSPDKLTQGDKFQFGYRDLIGVREVIHAHNGEVGVERNEKEGTSYFFILPEAQDETPKVDRYSSDVSVESFLDIEMYKP